MAAAASEAVGASLRPLGGATKGLSSSQTTRRVRELLQDLDWQRARVADVGAGRGHLCAELGGWLEREHGLVPAEHLFPSDLCPETFQVPRLACAASQSGALLPYADASVDAAVSIEVVEHVEDQFAFVRELARIVRPGGRVIVTTPNVLSLPSRLRTLCSGFPELFDPLPLSGADVRLLSGHIHPISPYFLAHAALAAGLSEPRLCTDRRKRSGLFLAFLLSPLLILARLAQRARLVRKRPDVLAQNRELLQSLWSLDLLTGRTAILVARKPAAEPR